MGVENRDPLFGAARIGEAWGRMPRERGILCLRRGVIRMPEYVYTVIFEPNETGGYTVSVPALSGLVTEGRTIEEARAMAEDAIRCYLEGVVKDGERIPEEPELLQEKIRIALPA